MGGSLGSVVTSKEMTECEKVFVHKLIKEKLLYLMPDMLTILSS